MICLKVRDLQHIRDKKVVVKSILDDKLECVAMNKTFLAALFLVASAISGGAYATNSEGENVVGRAADRAGNPVRRMQDKHYLPRSKRVHPIHRLKHAHPIRRLEGR